MRRGGLILVFAIGCGRLSFDEVVGSTPDADTSCWPLWHSSVTLEAPTLRDDLNTSDDDKNPFVTRDGLTIYFASTRPGGVGGIDFWSARRTDVTASFTVEGPVTELDSPFDEGRLEVDNSGLVAVFSAGLPSGAGNNDVYVATRTDMSAPFVIDPTITAALNDAGDQKDPHFVGGSTTRIYYSSQDTGFGVAERVGATYTTMALAGAPIVAGAAVYSDPQPSPDELTLVFSAGTNGSLLDFYVARRSSTSDAFGTPELLTAISSPALDRDISLTSDGCEVWFSRPVPDDQIFMSRVQH